MFDKLKSLFGRKQRKPKFPLEQYEQHDKLKEQGLERVLGKMHGSVFHALIPFMVGGAVDMYCFPNFNRGTAFATMELIEPDGSGPVPSRIGIFELVAFTKYKVGDESTKAAFEEANSRMRTIFTMIGWYSKEKQLNPGETAELPGTGDEPGHYLVFDQLVTPGIDFMIGDKKHGLLLVIEVFESEMHYAMDHGSESLLGELKKKGYYPFSDLDRQPVF